MADLKINTIILVIHSPFPGGAKHFLFFTFRTAFIDSGWKNDVIIGHKMITSKLLHYNALNSLWLLLMI